MFDPKLFDRSADFRGDYPRQLNEELAWFVGRYLVRHLKDTDKEAAPRVLVGRDGRISSPVLYRALVQGVASEGGVPIPCGLSTTDMICWGVGERRNGVCGGVIITASHNPPEYNGIKMLQPDPDSGVLPCVMLVSPRNHLKKYFEEDCGKDAPEAATGASGVFPYAAAPIGLAADFVEWACSRAPDREKFDETVVVDPGNGVGSVFLDPLKAKVPNANIESIAAQIDGRFPSRPSNPGLPGACDALGEKVRVLGAAFGVAFDGDADRLFMTDEKGNFVAGDHLLAAITKTALEQHPGDPIVFVATCSWMMVETVRKFGGKPIVSKVGQDTLKWVMKVTKANFGGESSAHFNYADSYFQDSGLIALMGLWQSQHASGVPLSKVIHSLEPWPQSGEINIRIESDDWKEIGEKAVNHMRQDYGEGDHARDCYVLPIDEISAYFPRQDGIASADDLFPVDASLDPEGKRFRYVHPDYTPDWWFNIRRSNNEPLMRVNIECRDEAVLVERAREIVNMARALCSKIGNCSTTVVNWGRVGPLE